VDLLVHGEVQAGLGTILEGKIPLSIDVHGIEHKLHCLCRLAGRSRSENVRIGNIIVALSRETMIKAFERKHRKHLEALQKLGRIRSRLLIDDVVVEDIYHIQCLIYPAGLELTHTIIGKGQKGLFVRLGQGSDKLGFGILLGLLSPGTGILGTTAGNQNSKSSKQN
jgi:hypothetical protein